MSYYRNQLETWLKEIDVNANSVLDVGGAALPVKGRTASWKANRYVILDNNAEKPYHKEWTTPNYFQDVCIDFDTWHETVRNKLENAFNVIFCLEVAEYWKNPCNAMKALRRMLKHHGVLYISFPTIYPLHEPRELDCLRYSRAWIEWALFGYEIEIVARDATKGADFLGQFYRAENMHPVRGTDAIFDIGYLCKAVKP
jgi:SAM-dependent methyltransferase